MWRKNRLTQLGIPDLQYMHKIFYVRNFSSSCYWCIPLSQPEVPVTEFQMRMRGRLWNDVCDTGEEGELELPQDRMIASALSWGLADPILSAPTLSWPMKDTNLGRLRFFPGQTDPTVSPVHFCTSFPRVFINLIYYPNYDQAEIPILWPLDAKNQFIGKDPDVGKGWGQEEKGVREDKMIVWHHRHHEFEQTPGDSEG